MDEKTIQEEISRTLAAFDDVPRQKASPFFYTRLKARMQSHASAGAGLPRFVHNRILVAVTGITLLVAVNLIVILNLSARSSEAQKEHMLASFAQEYHLSSSQY